MRPGNSAVREEYARRHRSRPRPRSRTRDPNSPNGNLGLSCSTTEDPFSSAFVPEIYQESNGPLGLVHRHLWWQQTVRPSAMDRHIPQHHGIFRVDATWDGPLMTTGLRRFRNSCLQLFLGFKQSPKCKTHSGAHNAHTVRGNHKPAMKRLPLPRPAVHAQLTASKNLLRRQSPVPPQLG